ncbi:MAG: ABC transporter ATPase [Salibacteraceae bacterium]
MSMTEAHPTSITDLNRLNDDARVWVFQSSEVLSGTLRDDISSALIAFLKDWAAHGKQLFAAFEIKYDRFIIIGIDEAMAQATGCSIDKLMKLIQELDQKHELDLLERMKVAYRDGEDIVECDVNTFTKMLAEGRVDKQTVVFNNVVQSIGELKTSWETSVQNSWHANLLA